MWALATSWPTTWQTPIYSAFPGTTVGFSTRLGAGYPNQCFRRLRVKNSSEPEVDISVFRFTLGIPGFDDSELPRILGFLFGGLIVLNHVFSAELVTGAQIRSEIAGIVLSLIAISLPQVNKELLRDTRSSRQAGVVTRWKQVFYIAEELNDMQKRELAWVSFALIRNTSTVGIIIWMGEGVVLARGCWTDSGPEALLNLHKMILKSSISSLSSAIYVQNGADQKFDFVPKGVNSMVAQPLAQQKGGLVVISDVPRAYRPLDRTWIGLMAIKLSDLL